MAYAKLMAQMSWSNWTRAQLETRIHAIKIPCSCCGKHLDDKEAISAITGKLGEHNWATFKTLWVHRKCVRRHKEHLSGKNASRCKETTKVSVGYLGISWKELFRLEQA